MTPTHDPNHTTDPTGPTARTAPASTPDPETEVVRRGPGPSRVGRVLLGAVVAIGVLLLGWLLFVYAEPDVPAGPAVDEIEQEEDDAIDSTDG